MTTMTCQQRVFCIQVRQHTLTVLYPQLLECLDNVKLEPSPIGCDAKGPFYKRKFKCHDDAFMYDRNTASGNLLLRASSPKDITQLEQDFLDRYNQANE
jgi:hypothetical protein